MTAARLARTIALAAALTAAGPAAAQEPPPDPGEDPADTGSPDARDPEDTADTGSPDAGAPEEPIPAEPPEPPPPPFVPPRLFAFAEVPYPAGVDAGTQQVTVELEIDATGVPTAVRLLSGEEPFASAVLAVAGNVRFLPAYEHGEAIPVILPLTWRFPAPAVSVTGVVKRLGTGDPLADAVVRVGGRQVHTGADGTFEVRNLEPGAYDVALEDVAYRLPSTAFELEPGDTMALELWVAEESWAQEVVGVYRSARDGTVRRSLSHDDIVAAPGALGDPVRALQNVAGVVRTPLDTGWVLVRGGNPDDTGIFLDGVRVPLLYHLGGFTSIVHPEFIDAVDFYPGAAPIQLGRSLSGAVNLRPRQEVDDLRVSGGVNLVWAQAYAQVPVGEHGGVAVAARRSYLDAVLTLVLDEDRAAIAPRFWDWSLRYDDRRFGLLFVGLSDEAETPTDDEDGAAATQRAIQLIGRAEVPVGPGTLQFRPWIGWRTHDIVAQLRQERVTDVLPGGRLEWTAEWDELDLVVGVEGQRDAYGIARDGDRRRRPFGHVDPYTSVAFGTTVRGRIGLRVDTLLVPGHFPRAGLSPRADLRWRATDALSVVGEVGRYHQPPPPVYLIAFPDGPYLHLEQSDGGALGMRFRRGPTTIDFDGWVRLLRNQAGLEEDGSMGQMEGRAWGAETTIRYDRERTSVQLIYQYARSVRREEPGDRFTPTLYEQPHRVNAIVVQRLPFGFTTAARWRFQSGFPADPDGVVAYDVLTQEEVRPELDRYGRLPPYHALDLKVSRAFEWRVWRLDTYIDVQNVYNRRVPEPAINGIDEDIVVYGFGLPVLPIFGVEVSIWPRQRSDRATSAR